MTMTLLQTVQEFCDRQGLDRPGSVMSSLDDTIRQIRGLLNELAVDITSRGESWEQLQKQATFTSVATARQGLVTTIAPYGFQYPILDSLYDRTERRPLYGPRGAAKWQESLALPQTGPFYSWRVWEGYIQLQPDPPAGHVMAFEYASNFAVLAVDGTTWKRRFTADTDVFQLDEELLIQGLRWKWRRAQSLSYAQEKQDWESLLSQTIGTSPKKGEVNLAGPTNKGISPGIYVPAGNWPV